MRRKSESILWLALLALSLTACGTRKNEMAAETAGMETVAETAGTKKNEVTGTETAAGTEKAETTGTEVAAAARPERSFRAGMVTGAGSADEGSFGQLAWEGLLRAERELGVEVICLEPQTGAECAKALETLSEERYDLIFAVGYEMEDALRAAAEEHPRLHYAIVDDAGNGDLKNVTCLVFNQAQASYLAGMAAGMSTESGKAGFVIGMPDEPMHSFGYGYCAGVLDANPEASVLQASVDSFHDEEGGRRAAARLIEAGADVIFHAAGDSGRGVIACCQEKGVRVIGADYDQSALAPEHVLASAVKQVDDAVFELVRDCREDRAEAGVRRYDLKNEGVDLVPAGENLPEAVRTAVLEVKEKIKSSEITVPDNQADFEAAYGDIYTLD
ncbi:MAG: BMP family ABC transporter substrate-binding protein [Lachnospiraceae bacterium]|nr:BMP family ABC transporter substrate-binding protein [Lachnospiraceae bacterium]